jgi:hypothetical protein
MTRGEVVLLAMLNQERLLLLTHIHDIGAARIKPARGRRLQEVRRLARNRC